MRPSLSAASVALCVLLWAGAAAAANGAGRAVPEPATGGGASGAPVAASGTVPMAFHGDGAPGPRVVRGRSPPAEARPAIWRTYDMIVDFQNLPRTYTCDQLWYEFRGILLRFGAPPAGINILPYDCSPTPSGDLKSPHVEARFQLPFLLQPGVAGAPIHAVEGTVRLSPGTPKTLHASDCELLKQIRQTMLASMPVTVDAAHFDCAAPAPRSGRFWVRLRLPVLAPARGSSGAADPR
jgi:hypothetical protein